VPKIARTPDLLSTRFINLIGKLFADEAREAYPDSPCPVSVDLL
jgi:hypothetical protein